MTHICVSNMTIIGSDNSLSPERRQAIIWLNAGILSLCFDPWERTSGKCWSKFIDFHSKNSFENVVCEMAVTLSWPQCAKFVPIRNRKSRHSFSMETTIVLAFADTLGRLTIPLINHQWPYVISHSSNTTKITIKEQLKLSYRITRVITVTKQTSSAIV